MGKLANDQRRKNRKVAGIQQAPRKLAKNHDPEYRTAINRQRQWARREVLEAGCFQAFTIGPPPAVGGLVMRNVDAFDMMFSPPYGMDMIRPIIDMIEQTIGVIESAPEEDTDAAPVVALEVDIQEGYAFIAMPIDPENKDLDDVLDSIKEAAARCGIHAERVDEPQSNERITDRILESIRKAQFVIVDLTQARPNVFYEAGYAHGIGKIPIYVTRAGTRLEFDLKDYPVIFFENMRELKDGLEARLRGLAKGQVE